MQLNNQMSPSKLAGLHLAGEASQAMSVTPVQERRLISIRPQHNDEARQRSSTSGVTCDSNSGFSPPSSRQQHSNHHQPHSNQHNNQQQLQQQQNPAKTEPTFIKQVRIARANRANHYCADCGARDPEWASISLCICICIECSGIHRQIGTHLSKVRSLTLDEWCGETLRLLSLTGNAMVKSVYEFCVPASVTRASPACEREFREVWIRQKYELRSFVEQTKPDCEVSDVVRVRVRVE